MPKQEERPDYFNENHVFSTVQRFVIFCLHNRDKIETRKVVSAHKTWVELSSTEQGDMRRRYNINVMDAAFADSALGKYTGYVNEKGEALFPVEITVTDERFSQMDDLVKKYTLPAKPEEKKTIETEIYKIIVELELDHRIDGDFRIEPAKDKQLSDLKEDYGNLSDRVNIANTLSQKFWKEWTWFKKREGIKDEDFEKEPKPRVPTV